MPFVKLLLLAQLAFAAKAIGGVQFHQDPRRKLTPSMNCHKYFVESHGEKSTTADNGSLRQQPPSKACRHKLSKSHEGLKVEMSVCLDPFSSSLRGMPNRKSRTGTNGFSHHTATATRTTHNDNNNNNLVYYLDNSQLQELLQLDDKELQELLQQKTTSSEKNAVFVVVDCKIDKDALKHHDPHRHLHQQNKSNHHHEKSYLLYFVATVLVAFFISRLRVNVELRLDVGGAGEQGALMVQPPAEAIVMANAIVINAEEQHAVPVYG